jgi:N-acyl-phosphatidylethanolamine-hydrolysing phospholipase D
MTTSGGEGVTHESADGAIMSSGGAPRGGAGHGAGRPPHHRAGGGFRNPWPTDEPHGVGDLLRWVVVDRLTTPRRPAPTRAEFAAAFPPSRPAFASPRAAPAGRLLATWVGHSTFLIQVGGLNVLTDPVWSEYASPLPRAGPRRWTPPGVEFDALPPIDVVLVSHDHYDHLDAPTVRRLVRRDPAALWLAPLGVGHWLARRGASRVVECDWWDEGWIAADGTAGRGNGADDARARFTCVPAQHFSGRRVNNRNETLWCGWTVRAGGRSVYHVGDTGYFPTVGDAARRAGGPFDLVLMPVGAYDPRWFMRPVHNAPEDAVRAYQELAAAAPRGGPTVMGAMHWGAFKLTDEPMDEPPRRTREAWAEAGLPPEALWVPAHGETREV